MKSGKSTLEITPFVDKKPSEEFKMLCFKFAETFATSTEIAQQITSYAKNEGLSPKTVAAEVKFALQQRGLSQRQIYRALPAELKIKRGPKTTRPKKDPFVTKWQIEGDFERWHRATIELAKQQCTKIFVIHDNKRIVDVQGE